MDSDIAHLAAIYRLWAWVEANRKKVIWSASALAIVVLGLWFYLWQRGEQQVAASEALTNLRPAWTAPGTPSVITADAYLRLCNEYPKTGAGSRALLLAATAFFTEGKYAEGKVQFDRFVRDYPENPLGGQALLGSAACLGAQGRVAEATAAYDELVRRHPTDPVVPRAKFALARLYEVQNRTDEAIKYYEELVRTDPYSSAAAEADIRLRELGWLRELKPSTPVPVNTALTNIVVLKTNKP
jgi:TolA-binding protein